MFSLLCTININKNEQVFARVTEELRFLLEFLFDEIFSFLQNPDDRYTAPEVNLLQNNFLPWIQNSLDLFFAANAESNKQLTPKIKILRHNDFLDYDFITNKVLYKSKITKNQSNNAVLYKFIGNLLAKMDVAIFFAVHNGQKQTSSKEDDFNSKFINTMKTYQKTLEKKYSGLFINAMEVVRA